LQEILKEPVVSWRGKLTNDFEKTVCSNYPAIAAIKEKLYALGALYASMTGSGSTVYGIFENENDVAAVFPDHYLIWKGKL
jgi:4-diphosphocytidyl-2-C-methyl-D-erythritol kinase